MSEPVKTHARWTPAEDVSLRRAAEHGTSLQRIALLLGRSEGSVRNRASTLGVSLAVHNRDPLASEKRAD